MEENNTVYRNIVVTDKNYRKLKGFGGAGDSFNDVITDMIEKIYNLQQSSRVAAREIVVSDDLSLTEKENHNE